VRPSVDDSLQAGVTGLQTGAVALRFLSLEINRHHCHFSSFSLASALTLDLVIQRSCQISDIAALATAR